MTNPVPDCWKRIGVFGDLSCPELEELVHCRNCFQYNHAGRTLFDREVPAGFLEEWTRGLTEVKEAEPGDTVSVIVFRVGGEWFSLRTICLQETTQTRPVHHVPHRTNNIFKGLVNINGELLLCGSVRDLMKASDPEEEPSGPRAYQRMLVIRNKGERYVFPVEEVLGIFRIPSSAFLEPPVTIAKSPIAVVETVFDLSGKKVGLLAEDKLTAALKRSLGN